MTTTTSRTILRISIFLLCLASSSQISAADSATVKPKYGPEAHRLSLMHDYFRHAPSPDFWALIPYYVPQRDGSSCSLASVTMAMNALRVSLNLSSDDNLILQDDLFKKVNAPEWNAFLTKGSHGIFALDQLGSVTRQSLKTLHLDGYTVDVVHATDSSPAMLSRLRKLLIANEKSASDIVLINFIQGVYTGDADAGHIAPIGAYDPVKKMALVLDPDREWYEPYWVKDETLLKGMATLDKSSDKNRGWIWIHPAAKP